MTEFKKRKYNILLKTYIKHILMIIILPLMLFYLILGLFFVKQAANEQKIYTYSLMQNKLSVLDNLFHQINSYYESCLIDSNITLLLSKPVLNNNSIGPAAAEQAGNAAKNMHNFFNSIDSIYLYSYYSDYVYGLVGYTSNSFARFGKKEWYTEYKDNEGKNYVKSIESDGEQKITFCYNIQTSSESRGILVIEVSVPTLLKELGVSGELNENISLVLNAGNAHLIDYSGVQKSGKTFSQELQSYPATLYYSVSMPHSSSILRNNSILFVLLGFIALLLTVLLAFLFSKKDYAVISSVINEIENPYIRSNLSYDDMMYIDFASESMDSEDDLKNKLLEKITDLKKAQLIALQCQINPHFISNTLNMIASTVMLHNREDTDSVYMIQHLSRILNYALRIKEYIVPLRAEISSLESYVTILNLRLGNSFDTEWKIPPSLLDTKTLKSLMQPLIENSIEHGIQKLPSNKRGKLTIEVSELNNTLYITVTDNGVGFDHAKLQEINNAIHSNEVFQNEHIGLKNVAGRIKLLFGNSGGCQIESNSEHTSVTIYHPIIE